jgi:hypothetical protein
MNHQRLLHPHVVQLKEVFAAKPYLALVMEFVPNGDMFQVGSPACTPVCARKERTRYRLGAKGVAGMPGRIANGMVVARPQPAVPAGAGA